MGSVYVLQPRFYELLDFQPQPMSMNQLSRCLIEFLREHHFEIWLPEERYIDLTGNIMKELTGFDDEKYILQRNGITVQDWWKFVQTIYERWMTRSCANN